MLNLRLIPVLLLKNNTLVKTVNFTNPQYIGDPINTALMFNDFKADELIILDIDASVKKKNHNIKLLENISNNCFMPIAFGGGINSLEYAKLIIKSGYEKIIINYHSIVDKHFISKLANHIGSQAVIVSIDYKFDKFSQKKVFTLSGKKNTNLDPKSWAIEAEKLGAGEIMLTSIDNEGLMNGYDIDYIDSIARILQIPLIANAGAGSLDDLKKIAELKSVSAAAFGSLAVYQKKNMGVLINYPKLF